MSIRDYINRLNDNPEEMAELLEKILEDERVAKEKISKYYTNGFSADAEELWDYIVKNGSFCYDTWLYDIAGLPPKPSKHLMGQLGDIVSTVKQYGTELPTTQNMFASERYTCKGIIITFTHGQGTNIRFSLNEY